MIGRRDMAENELEQTDQNWMRFKDPVMALAAGAGAALVVVTLPHVYLENIIGATGLSEVLPAAAPPLGNTARGLIAVLAGLVSASAIYLFLNRKGSSDMGVALREQINAANPVELDYEAEANAKKSRFSLPKFDAKSLTKFLKKPKKDKARVMDLADLPQLRKLKDEPVEEAARPSIFAEPETANAMSEAIAPFEKLEPVEAPAEEMVSAPAQPVAEPVQAVTTAAVEPEVAVAVAPDIAMPVEDLSHLNIAQLADRLAAGLNRLKQLEAASAVAADMVSQTTMAAEPVPTPEPAPQVAVQQPVLAEPVAAPMEHFQAAETFTPPPLKEVVQPGETMVADRQADMDVALKAALGTLEKMTAQR